MFLNKSNDNNVGVIFKSGFFFVRNFLLGFILIGSFGFTMAQEKTPVILMHYMGWYGDTINYTKSDSLRHWKFGHAQQPLIGQYDSKTPSLLIYHILLSWSCGIDGVVINVKDAYDDICMKNMISTLKTIQKIDSLNFKYEFAISYDDQGFDLSSPFDTAISKLSFLRDSILPYINNYVRYNGHPIIFSFDYPNKYLTAKGFRSVINDVFKENKPLLIWNTLDGAEDNVELVDAYYPWVQPGAQWDKKNGLIWGKDYLDYYYSKVNEINRENKFGFTCGGVWPGFDDRKNTSWGGDRLMQRQNGIVYDSTWSYILSYNKPLPLKFVVIETWNDWNEGTEIEPSIEDGYKYLELTIKNVNRLKGKNIDGNITKFEAAKAIYNSSFLIENKLRQYDIYYPLLEASISSFLKQEYKESILISYKIIHL